MALNKDAAAPLLAIGRVALPLAARALGTLGKATRLGGKAAWKGGKFAKKHPGMALTGAFMPSMTKGYSDTARRQGIGTMKRRMPKFASANDAFVSGFLEKVSGLPVRYDPFINLGREAVKKYTKKRLINPVAAHAIAGGVAGGGAGAAIPNKEDDGARDRMKRIILGTIMGAGAAGGAKYYRNLVRGKKLSDIEKTIKNPKTEHIDTPTPYNEARDMGVRGYAMKDTKPYGSGYTGKDLYKLHEERLRDAKMIGIDPDSINIMGMKDTEIALRNKYVHEAHGKFQKGFKGKGRRVSMEKGDAADKLLDRLKHLSHEQQAKYLHPDALIKRKDMSPKAKEIAESAFKRVNKVHSGSKLHPIEDAGRQYRKKLDDKAEILRKGMGGIL